MLAESRSRNTSLERERDDYRSRFRSAERERDEAQIRVVSEAEQRYNAELAAANSQLSSLTDTIGAAKAAYQNAMEQGEHARAAEAHVMLTRAAAAETQWQQRKAYLESNKPQFAAPQQRPSDDIDAQLLPSEREWVASRPRFRTDPSYRERVIRASSIANMDHERGSEGYLRRIEEIMGETRQASQSQSGNGYDADEPPARRPSADLAPTRRSAPGAAPAGRVRVELTATEREIADAMYGDPNTAINYIQNPAERYEHYFKNKEAMRAAGRI